MNIRKLNINEKRKKISIVKEKKILLKDDK